MLYLHRSNCFQFFQLFLLILLLFSRIVLSDSLRPHGLQHTRFLCPSLSPRVCSNSCPLSWWCYPTISFSITFFSSCPESFPASGSFPVSQLFASGGQSIRASASATVFPKNIQGRFPLGLTWFDLFVVQGTLKSLVQHHNSKASILQCSAFLIVQLSHPYMTTRKRNYCFRGFEWWSDMWKVKDGSCAVTKLCLTLVIPLIVACQAPLSMGFFMQDY